MNINHSDEPRDAGLMAAQAERIDIRHLTALQLAQLGVSQLAYIKRVPVEDGGVAFAIHAADGTPMALADDCELAAAAIRQHDMIAALVH
jgi:hypothetical protein